jgi:hypothetical protein
MESCKWCSFDQPLIPLPIGQNFRDRVFVMPVMRHAELAKVRQSLIVSSAKTDMKNETVYVRKNFC